MGEEKITADFKFIPTYKELGEIVLPVSDAPLRPPFLERKKFENFPKDVKQTKFSQSGDLALITLGKELYIYYVADRAVDTIDLKPETAADWLGDKIIYLEESEQKHLLKLRDGKENKLLASFERPLKNPTLFGSPDGKKSCFLKIPMKNIFIILLIRKSDREKDWRYRQAHIIPNGREII